MLPAGDSSGTFIMYSDRDKPFNRPTFKISSQNSDDADHALRRVLRGTPPNVRNRENDKWLEKREQNVKCWTDTQQAPVLRQVQWNVL